MRCYARLKKLCQWFVRGRGHKGRFRDPEALRVTLPSYSEAIARAGSVGAGAVAVPVTPPPPPTVGGETGVEERLDTPPPSYTEALGLETVQPPEVEDQPVFETGLRPGLTGLGQPAGVNAVHWMHD